MLAILPAVKKFDIRRFARGLALAAALALAVPTTASAGMFGFFSAAPLCRALFDTDEFTRFGAGHTAKASLPSQFRVLVLNVFKGAKRGLAHDLKNLAAGTDLVLFQEAVDKPKFIRAISWAHEKLKWTMARSFLQKQSASYTGVATGSTVEPVHEEKLLSPVTEPFSKTPKTALVSDFKLAGRDGREHVLRVINVHAINFVMNASFEAHMQQIFAAVENHRGPIMVAGDWNTWNSERKRILESGLERFGVRFAHSAPGLFLTLDYVFTRGLKVIKAHDLAEIRSSDHQPMLIDFELDENVLNENAQLLRELHPTVVRLHQACRFHDIA